MTPEEAEEFTQTVEAIGGGWWRQIAWADGQGIPQALGLTATEWGQRVFGAMPRLSIAERRDAVAELVAEGRPQRDIADVLGVDQATVSRDANASRNGSNQAQQGDGDASASPLEGWEQPSLDDAVLTDEDMEKLSRWQELADREPVTGEPATAAVRALGHAITDIDLARRVRSPDEPLADLIAELRRTLEDLGGLPMLTPDAYGPSARAALAEMVARLSRDDLERQVIESTWRSLAAKLRSQARLDNSLNEMTLFEMHTSLPPVIRIVDGGVEDFVDRDLASFRQVDANERWIYEEAQRRVGIAERRIERLQRWRDDQPADFDDDAPIGPYIFRGVHCSICHLGWRENDPFERAHDVAVVAGGGDQTVRWAHLTCNRREGKG